MGDLVRTPHNEVTATLEVLEVMGVLPEHLKKFRGASSWVQQQIANAIIASDENFFSKPSTSASVPPPPEPFWKKISKTSISVNLGFSPKLPFDGAVIEKHNGDGWVLVQKRKDGLYVGGHRIILHLSERQQNGKSLKGYELREELTGKPVLNANVLDALFENQHLIPEDWKKDENGNIRYIFFWGTIYRNPGTGNLCVRCLYFRVGSWYRNYGWFDSDWRGNAPAALLASKS